MGQFTADMKSFVTYLLLLSGWLLIRPTAYAQESYFNVTESDVAERKEIVVQQQFSLQSFYRSITTFDYGIANDFEIGANLINLDYYPTNRRFMRNDSSTEKAYSPLLTLNAQKIIKLGHHWHAGIGGQAGWNLTPNEGQHRFVHYVYANLNRTFQDDHYKITAGIYNGHVRYLGGGPLIGFQTGFEAGIIYQKLHLLGDWISGTHEVGQLVLGLEVFLSKKIPISLGWQRQNQDGSSALVVQLTYRSE